MGISKALLALSHGARIRIGLAVLAGLAGVALSIFSLWLSAQAIASLFAGGGFNSAVPLLLAAAAAALARGLLALFKEWNAVAAAGIVKARIRADVFRQIAALGPGWLEVRQTGDALATAVDAVESVEAYFGRYLPQLLVTSLAPVGILVFLGFIHWSIPLVYAACVLAAMTLPSRFRKWSRGNAGAFWMQYGAMTTLVVDSVQGLPTLKAFARSEARGREIAQGADAVARAMSRVFAVTMGVSGLMDLIVVGGGTAALLLGAWLGSNGLIPVSSLIVILMVGGEAFRPVRELNGLFHQGENAAAAAEKVLALLAERPAVADPAAAAAPTGIGSLELDNVAFSYDGGDRPALSGISLSVRPGERVALVGASGSGKSTVINLAMRFVDPTSGTVRVGGVDARSLRLQDVRAHFSLVSQDTYLFHGTIAANLRIAKPNATDSELRDAARAAQMLDTIDGLPAGFETVVGERGMRLSGGQRQRIAIARAVLSNAPILLLDEPTSSVDAENEEAIQAAMEGIAQGRTTITIAHRLNTVQEADRIIVMSDGRVVEEGSHASLLAQGGPYARLVEAQRERIGTEVAA